MRKWTILCIALIGNLSLFGQVYLKKQTRHRFAQLHLGVDLQTNLGGQTSFINQPNTIQELDLGQLFTPRFTIGGTHFWGHADIYIAFPLYNQQFQSDGQEINFLSGVETAFKYYPIRIQRNRITPFVGLAITPNYFEQDNTLFPFGDGPELNHTAIPLLTGFTYALRNQLIELGISWNYANQQNYFISRSEQVQITTPPVYLNLAYRYVLDTTLPSEKAWESGELATMESQLAEKGKLSGLFLGAGFSSAFWGGKGNYNTINRPYIETYSTSIFPEFNLGYYSYPADLNIGLTYRQYSSSTNSYGASQVARRRSAGLEVTKFLFDYNGFAPFLGPIVSLENLSFEEAFERNSTLNIQDQKIGYGITFGWDIRPNNVVSWILRTNLRWYPDLKLEVQQSQNIAYSALEFNFIELIIYPNRMGRK